MDSITVSQKQQNIVEPNLMPMQHFCLKFNASNKMFSTYLDGYLMNFDFLKKTNWLQKYLTPKL